MLDTYQHCVLCPRNCGVDRLSGIKGYCKETAELRLASAGIHWGEEPPITGTGGSGTIFVSGCNLGCRFCQNYQISQNGMGRAVGVEEFARICLTLEEKGVENINIVTGTHAVPALVAGIKAAQSQGLSLPVLWNSSAYETSAALSLLDPVIAIYLPDLKTLDPTTAGIFFKTTDYPQYAEAAILRMMENHPLTYKKQGHTATLERGVIIRHLVVPLHLESTREVLRWFAEKAQGRALLSVMTQYTPINGGPSIPNRSMNEQEYDTILGWLEEFDIDEGFFQELDSGTEWLPDFNQPNPFASEHATPLWHWKT
ncbi:MAG: radical SAM protein, partial [Treponema sp.]|nr:radical SAM protein [Treponema sp.]